MGIRYRPTGTAQLEADLGTAIGRARAAKEKADRAAQQKARYQGMQHEMAMTQWREQLRQQSEQRDIQREDELDQAARDWEVQKIQMRSAQDFEMLQLRQRMKDEQDIKMEIQQREKYQQAVVRINELQSEGHINEEQAAVAMARAKMNTLGVGNVGLPSMPQQRQDDMSQLFDLSAPATPAPAAQAAPAPTMTTGGGVDPLLKLAPGTALSDDQRAQLIAQLGSKDAAIRYAQDNNLR